MVSFDSYFVNNTTDSPMENRDKLYIDGRWTAASGKKKRGKKQGS